MAPSFLSRIVKSSATNSRTSIDSPSRPSTSDSPSRFSTNSTGPVDSHVGANEGRDITKAATPESGSEYNVNVKVVPPSPATDTHDFSDRNADTREDRLQNEKARVTSPASISRPSSAGNPSSTTQVVYDDLATPTPDRPMRPANMTSNNTSSTVRLAQPRPLSPASSTGDLRSFAARVEGNSIIPPVPIPQPPSRQASPDFRGEPHKVYLQTSPRPFPGTGNHARAATTPAQPINGTYDSHPAEEPLDAQNAAHRKSVTDAGPLVESPTALRTEFRPADLNSPNGTPVNGNADGNLLRPRADSDSVSIVSTKSDSGKKKKTWRRASSASKRRPKPTGLASALAASGLAMANTAVSHPHLSPQAMGSSSSIGVGRSSSTQQKSPNTTSHRASGSTSSIPKPEGRKNSLDLPPPSSRNHGSPTSRSLNLSNHSELSFESESDEESEEAESVLDDELDLKDVDIPVTGFAVASSKRNADFHELFSNIPEGDYLIEDYGCALQRDILVQGRLYISENHICFHANIFGWVTDLTIPMYEITSLEKKMTALFIPNAVQITTRQAKYTFASFLSRDTTYDVIFNVWRLARPDDPSTESFVSPRGSLENSRPGMDEVREARSSEHGGAADGGAVSDAASGVRALPLSKKTQCECGKKGEHYSEIAMDVIIPGTPDKIYNLMFTSGFIKDFMGNGQKLMDIQISDWIPIAPGSTLLARNMSYIKPLTGSLGPKQTKCEIRDETAHCDFDDYICMITTTRTPEVPSGGVFSVKTRTCIMWASAVSSRVLITTQVEWTGRSFIKGIIEKSAIDGQKTYHVDLDRAMREYIQQHQSEFVPAGVDPLAVLPAEVATPANEKVLLEDDQAVSPEELARKREQERNRRGLQWAWDTFEGTAQVAKRSATGAIELIKDAWDQSSSTTILIFIIVLLVISNLWTLLMVGRREDVGRRKEMKRMEEREKWVHGIVTAFYEEMAAGKTLAGLPPAGAPVGDWQAEVNQISKTLDTIEERVKKIRETLQELD